MQGLARDVVATVSSTTDDEALLQRLRDRDAEMRVLSQRLSLLLTVPDSLKVVASPTCAKDARISGPSDTAAQDGSREILAARLEPLYSSRQQVNRENGFNISVEIAVGLMSSFCRLQRNVE